MIKISFIIPSRNNKKYLQQAVKSILDCYGTQHDLVLLDDASSDGTWEWIMSLKGDHFIKYRNEGPERVGHTILYDKGVEISKTDIFTIFHADMITTPNHIPNLLKHLKSGTVVCATRIEPPLHPPGPEKFVKMYGMEPEEFRGEEFRGFVDTQELIDKDKTTKGVFAPWCMYKKDFQQIGGHDPLFAPMELEDSDIFNRMFLNGYNLIQSRDSFVYHMTCRGSRFKDGLVIEQEIPLPDGTVWYKPKDSDEYKALRQLKFREWWRKWGSNVLHDEYMLPRVSKKYDIGFVVKNSNESILEALEPWCSTIYVDCDYEHYIKREQSRTLYNLLERIKPYDNEKQNHIIVEFDAKHFTQNSFNILQQLSDIISEANEIGEFELDVFKISIFNLTSFEKNLIVCNTIF